MRAVSERARYHLTESLAFFVIVPNANCLPGLGGVQSFAKVFRKSLLHHRFIKLQAL